jgi:DNA-binding GntR family transcriptional regulator
MVVRLYVFEEVDELYNLRILLEPVATERAVDRATPVELKEIKRIHRRLLSAVNSPSATNSAQLNAAWHHAICSASGSPYLIQFIQRLWAAMPVESVWLSSHSSTSIEEHQAIMDAFERRDPKAAAEIMKRHIQQGREMHAKRLREMGLPLVQERPA